MDTVRRLRMCSPGRIHYIGNGIDVRRFSRDALGDARARLRRELGFDDDHVVVGIVGRLVGEKGFEEFFEALVAVSAAFPQVRALIVGPRDEGQRDGLDPEVCLRRLDRSETKPGRRRSAPGPENQIPIPSRPAFRRASKARINKGEALGNQHDRAFGLNLTVAAVISRDTIYPGNAVASFPSKPQRRPWSVSLQTRRSCGQNSLKASRSPAAITSVC